MSNNITVTCDSSVPLTRLIEFMENMRQNLEQDGEDSLQIGTFNYNGITLIVTEKITQDEI